MNISDKDGNIITVALTDDWSTWEDRKVSYSIPIGNYIGSIQFGDNFYGNIVSNFYCGFDNDINPEAVVIWESIDESQMQDDIKRIFLRAAVFPDEQDCDFICPIPYLPFARAGVCMIIKSYIQNYDRDTYDIEMNHFNDEYTPYISALFNGTEIPNWEELDDNIEY